MTRLCHLGLVATLMLVPCVHSFAQPNSLDKLYGQGVHSFFDGHLPESVAALSQAIDKGTRDPRVYYFRGLAQMSLGKVEAAHSDFNTGAKLEVDGTGRFYSVSRALERVQGAPRIALETARHQARVAAAASPNPQSKPSTTVVGKIPVLPDRRIGESSTKPRQTNFPDVSAREFPATPFESFPPEEETKVPTPPPEDAPPTDTANQLPAVADGANTEKQPPAKTADPFSPPQPVPPKQNAEGAKGSDAGQDKPKDASSESKDAKKPKEGPKDDPFDTGS